MGRVKQNLTSPIGRVRKYLTLYHKTSARQAVINEQSQSRLQREITLLMFVGRTCAS